MIQKQNVDLKYKETQKTLNPNFKLNSGYFLLKKKFRCFLDKILLLLRVLPKLKFP